MRTAADEILDLNLGEKTCQQVATRIKDLLASNKSFGRMIKEAPNKNLLKLYYSLELVREEIWEEILKRP